MNFKCYLYFNERLYTYIVVIQNCLILEMYELYLKCCTVLNFEAKK